MTILRFPQDVELHDENGNHVKIVPSDTAAFKAKMKRHLARHAKDTGQAEELGAMVKEWADADLMVANADAARWEVRASIMKRAKEMHENEGVSIVELARLFDMNERTLRDYFEHGRPQTRGRRRT